MAAHLTYWLENVAVHQLRENTHTRYAACVDRYLIPGLGKKKLVKLTAQDVRTWRRPALHQWPRCGGHQVLSEAEQATVRQAVLDHAPSGLGLSGQLWTRAPMGELISKLYGIRFTEPGVGKYLKR